MLPSMEGRREYYKQRHLLHKQERNRNAKDYYYAHKEQYGVNRRAWKKQNPEKVKEIQKQYRIRLLARNPAAYMVYRRNYHSNNPLAYNLRSRLAKAIRNSWKNGSAVKDLGCSIAELRVYLTERFEEGMTWENHGTYGWHIDHIVPLAFFDLTNREQFLTACHYTNLQPLWAADNLKKGATYQQ